MNRSFLRIGVLCAVLPALTSVVAAQTNAPAPVLFNEPFEARALDSWKIDRNYTDTDFTIDTPGQLSATSLNVDKHDMSGFVTLSREFEVPAGHYLRLSADLQAQFVGPYAEYYMHTLQLDADGKTVEQKSFAFDDGASVSSIFGGAYKTPQTLGEWKKTRHIVQTNAATQKLRVLFIFRNGQQRIRLDNFQIEDLGTQAPAPASLPFYEKALDSSAALLTLDMLVPGFTYEVTAITATPQNNGMGVAMSWADRTGQWSDSAELPLIREDGATQVYRLTIPDRAVQVRLDLHNEDLTTLGWNHEKDYRRWKSISIRTLATRLAPDTLFYNYERNIATHPELVKPREYVDFSEFDRTVINAHLTKRPVEDAQAKKVNGGMALQFGNETVPPIMNASIHTLNKFDVYSELGKRGLNLIRVDNVKGGPALNGQWLGVGRYDFSSVDEQIYRALKQNPDARIVFAIEGLYTPASWGQANPNEILKDSDGLALAMNDPYAYNRIWGKMDDPRFRERVQKDKATYFPSPASQPYRAAVKEFLGALRRYIEAQPYGKAVVGYQLTWGYDAQWGWPASGSNADQLVDGTKTPPHDLDYSAPMQAYFREFLRRKYKTEAALQQAWKDPKVTFATAAIPSPEVRNASKKPNIKPPIEYLLDPATQMQVIDYNICYGEIVGDLLNEFALAIKAASPRKVLATAYFQDLQRSIGEEKVLANPGLDISGGPSYESREIGQSGISPHLYSSFSLHEKLDFTEVDHRVFSTIYRNYRGNQVFETPRKSISVLQREFGRQMVNGGGGWTLDMGMGWFAQPIIADTLGDIRRTFAKVMTVDRSSSAKMAMFVGDYSRQVRNTQQFLIRSYYLAQYIRSTLAQSGVAVDVYRMGDLPRVAANYKVFLFPFAYGLTDEERKNVDALKKDENLLVFGPAVGYVGSSKLSLQNVTELTGMQMVQDDTLPFTVQVTNTTHPITKEMRGYIGSDESDHQRLTFPMFAVTDPKAVPLAEYVVKGKGKAGIAFKDNDTWQSVYIGAMGFYPAELFRGLARQKGLHIYSSDGDVLFANKGLVAMHASSDGTKTLELPTPAHVTSLWDNIDLGIVKTIRRPMKTGENALYLLESK